MPVEASVAAIFCPIRPALPIPVTITLPRHARTASHGLTEFVVQTVRQQQQRLPFSTDHFAPEPQLFERGQGFGSAAAASVLIVTPSLTWDRSRNEATMERGL